MFEGRFSDHCVAFLEVKGVFRVDTNPVEYLVQGNFDKRAHLKLVGSSHPQNDFNTSAQLRQVEWNVAGLNIQCSVVQYDGQRYAIESVFSGDGHDLSFVLKTVTLPLVMLFMNADIQSGS